MNYKQIREDNLKKLLEIRDADETSPAVQIQAIQTISKILAEIEPADEKAAPTEKSILDKIRGQS